MKHRLRLFLIWILGLFLGLLAILVSYLRGELLPEDISPYLLLVTGIFAPYLTPILAFWFTSAQLIERRESSRPPFVVAISCSIVFIMVVDLIIWSAVFGILDASGGEGFVVRRLEAASAAGDVLAFLVGPAIGYYFGSEMMIRRNLRADESERESAKR